MKGTNWLSAPWNNPKLCPRCGKPGTVQVGGRLYSADCARTIDLFLAGLKEKPLPSASLIVEP